MIVIVCGGRDFGHRLSEAGAIHGKAGVEVIEPELPE